MKVSDVVGGWINVWLMPELGYILRVERELMLLTMKHLNLNSPSKTVSCRAITAFTRRTKALLYKSVVKRQRITAKRVFHQMEASLL